MASDLLDLLDSLPPDELRTVVDRLSPEDVLALQEELPRAEHVTADPAAAGPAEFAETLDPGFRRRSHLTLLSDAIWRTVEEAQTGTGPGRLIVNMPPRVGKSLTASKWTPGWFLERHPDKRVVLTSHEGNYAISWGRTVRDTLRRSADHGVTQARVARHVAAAGEWETTQGGGMLARGIGGSITGRGAHLLVIDDPLRDLQAAHSHAVRNGQWEWWLAAAQGRLEPGAAVVLVMTRWHEDDLAGRLMSDETEGDPADWRVLRIPAVGEGQVDDVDAGHVPPDALDRADGEPLLLASTDETTDDAAQRWAKLRENVGPYIWAGMYQQRPSEPEGTILRRAWWQHYRWRGDHLVLPDGTRVPVAQLRVVQSWDMAFKDNRQTDYVVGQVWGSTGADRFLLEQWRDRADYVASKQAMRDLHARWPQTSATYVEDKANGPAIIADLRRELSGLVPNDPKGDKTQRAYAVQGDLEAGNLWLPAPDEASWDVRALVQEAADFPNAAHDDQVDALTQAVLRLRGGQTGVGVPTGSKHGQDPQQATMRHTRRRIDRG